MMEEELAERLLRSPRLAGLRRPDLAFFPWTRRVVEALDRFVGAGRLGSLGLRFCTPHYSSGFAWTPTYHTATRGTNLLEAFRIRKLLASAGIGRVPSVFRCPALLAAVGYSSFRRPTIRAGRSALRSEEHRLS
jgi:hypothetical protein